MRVYMPVVPELARHFLSSSYIVPDLFFVGGDDYCVCICEYAR